MRSDQTIIRTGKLLTVLASVLFFVIDSVADDTDIYLDPAVPTGAEPMVMFVLDYRSNLGSTACAGTECDSLIAQRYLPATGPYTFFDVLRAVLTKVLDPLDGLQVGFMVNHANSCTGNPTSGPGISNCSNGAYVLSGFNLMSAGSDDPELNDDFGEDADKLRLRDKLDAMLTPGGSLNHSYQGKEAYFELFRYLTGQGVYNAHLGFEDFGDKDSGSSLFHDFPGISRDLTIEEGEGAECDEKETTKRRQGEGSDGDDKKETTKPREGEGSDGDDKKETTKQRQGEGSDGDDKKETTKPRQGEDSDGDDKKETTKPREGEGSYGSCDYISPLAGNGACSRIFVINFMFQVSNQEDDSDAAITDTGPNGGMAGIRLSGRTNNFPTVIEYMNDSDLGDGSFGTVPKMEGNQNVTSYFLVDPTKINTTTNGYARAGGTGAALALSDNPDELIATLNNIFRNILSVSTTFVAPSVPVNAFNRAQVVNEVFLALFEADENGAPAWPGNLKKVVIGEDADGNTEVQDANGVGAIAFDGRLRDDAVTFWTDTATLATPVDEEVAGADGPSVKRGGAGQAVPGYVAGDVGNMNSDGLRQLFVEDPSDVVDGLMALDADDLTAIELWDELTANWSPAASAPTYRDALLDSERDKAVNILRYARGLLDDGLTALDWVIGDPLHSQPRPINYGGRAAGYDETNPDIRILMGTNDGFMHMFRNTDASGGQDGAEVWAFMPRDVINKLDRLRQNAAGTPIHPITVDGSPVVLIEDLNLDGNIVPADGDSVRTFFGLRRGGKSLYALDISNPDAPKYMWTISKGAAGSDFAELGQTWSTPSLGKMQVGTDILNVLIFAAGFNGDDDGDDLGDLGKDAKNRATRAGTAPALGTDDDEGNAIFVVDADTGDLVWKSTLGASAAYDSASFTLTHEDFLDSVPAEVSAVDTTGNGLVDRAYFGDTGGVLWRIDFAGHHDGAPETIISNDRSLWSLTKLLSVGRHVAEHWTVAEDRRFFNRPDVAQSQDDIGLFDAVLIGTGDREDPNANNVVNEFYLVKDRATTSGVPPTTLLDHDDLTDLTSNCLGDDSCVSPPDLALGWKIELQNNGEKNLAAAITADGIVFFTTFEPTPPASVCSLSEGTGRVYAVSLLDATAVFNFDLGNDDPSADTYGLGYDDPAVTYDRSDTLGSGGIPVEVVPLGRGEILVPGQEVGENIMDVGGRTSFKTYWHEHAN